VYHRGAFDYYSNDEGGFKVFVPYNHSSKMTGEMILTNMFTGLGDIYETSTGTNYAPAGARWYNGGSVGTIDTSLYIKNLSTGTLGGDPYVSNRATSYLSPSLTSNNNVEFRYAGVLMNTDGSGTVVTNPTFVVDTLHASGSGEEHTFTRYNNHNNDTEDVTLYGTAIEDVFNMVDNHVYSNHPGQCWGGSSGVPTNERTGYNDNETQAEKSFETWADKTSIGDRYRSAYTDMYGADQWWRVLNDYLRIDGNIDEGNSVLFTMVWNDNGHTYYHTYGILQPINNNMIASILRVKDNETGESLGTSERYIDTMKEAVSGVDTNVFTAGSDGTNGENAVIKLKRKKLYTLETLMTFASGRKRKPQCKQPYSE
jgi:hypothetical protein